MASRQLGIAHDDSDDASMVAWLEKQGEFRCLPAIAESVSVTEPQRITQCAERRLIVFFREHSDIVVEGGHLTEKNPRRIVYASSDNDGLIFEWEKTAQCDRKIYTSGGGQGGRIYSCDPDVPNPATEKLRRFVLSLCRWIRRTHPWVSQDRYPIFVGSSLGARVQSGKATLVYPSGKRIQLTPNQNYKANA